MKQVPKRVKTNKTTGSDMIRCEKLKHWHYKGIKSKYITSDNIFILQSSVNKYCVKKSANCFIDLKKAFDWI